MRATPQSKLTDGQQALASLAGAWMAPRVDPLQRHAAKRVLLVGAGARSSRCPHERPCPVRPPAPAGGSISALVTIPIDVLVATFQSAAKAGKKVSIVETFREQGGAAQVIAFSTRGLVARVAHVAATTMMMKTVTSIVYDILFPTPVGAAA